MAGKSTVADDFLSAPEIEPAARKEAAPAAVADDFLSAPEYVPPKTAEPKPLYSSVGDIGKSAASGAADAVYALPGLPGSLMNASQWVGDRLRTGVTNMTGWDPASGGDSVREALGNPSFLGPKRAVDPTGKTQAQVGEEIRGQASKRENLPGMGDMVEKAHEVGLPFHEPESGLGSFAHTAGNIGAGLVAAPVSIPSKILGTIEGSVGTKAGEWVGDKVAPYLKENGVGDTFGLTADDIKAATTTIGGGLGVGNGLRVGQKYKSGLARSESDRAAAQRADESYFRANPQERPPLTMEQAAERGMHPLSAAGPNVRALAAKSANTPELEGRLGGYNEHVSDLSNTTDRLIAPIRTAGEMYRDAQERLRGVNNENYTRTMGLPHAQSVWTPELESLLNRPNMDHYVREAVKMAQQDGVSAVPPMWQEPQPARHVTDFTTQSMTTHEAVPGRWIARQDAPPNLAFFDYLKKAMDDDITNQSGPLNNKETNSIRSTRRLKNEIINDHVDHLVPEYAQTRGIAEDMFGERDAIKQGSNFLKNRDSFSDAEVSRAIEQMPDNHRVAFAHGFLADLQRMVVNDPPAATRLINRPGFQSKLRAVAGDQIADQMITAAKAQKVNPAPTPPSAWDKVGHALVGYGLNPVVAHGAVTAMQGVGMGALNPVTAPVAAYQVAKRFALDHVGNRQQATANAETIRHLTTRGRQRAYVSDGPPPAPPRADPPMTRGVGGDQEFSGAPPLTITPRRAAGGELGPKPRGKINVDSLADQLVASVEKARAEISGQTEQNLALPDTHVVHALHVAKHALG